MKKKVNLLMTAITLTTVLLVTLASCGQMADVPQGYAKVRVGTPNGRAITADEKQNSRFEYYFNDSRSDSNETVAQVSSRLKIRVVAIDTRNGRQVGTGEKTITVAPGMNNVDILIYEDRGANANMVRWSAGVATVGDVQGIPADESRSPGEVITVPQDPTWVHAKTFDGWSYGNVQLVDENDSTITGNLTAGDKFKMPDGGVTLTAEWTKNQYTITYAANSAKSGNQAATDVPTPQQNIEALSPTNVSASTLQAIVVGSTTYTFTGWNTDENGNGTRYSAGQSIAQMTGDMMLYAQWTDEIVYTVTYDKGSTQAAENDITNWRSSDTFIVGTSSAISLPTLTATGYNFTGWQDDNGDAQNPYTPNATVTLTAQWEAKTYTFEVNGNGATNLDNPFVDTSLDLESQPVTGLNKPANANTAYSGKCFEGWSYTQGGAALSGDLVLEDILNEPTVQISSNNVITLYAVWKDAVAGVTDSNGTETNFDDFDTAWESDEADGGTIKLYSDITLTSAKHVGIASDQGTAFTVGTTLDLNGHTITYGSSSAYIGLLQADLSFTLKDTSSAGNGKISIGSATYGILVAGGTFSMEGGSLTDMDFTTTANNSGGSALTLHNAAGAINATMTGGSISNNRLNYNLVDASTQAVGVLVRGASTEFSMSGGSISNNSIIFESSGYLGYGAGVMVMDNSTFRMSGTAEITGNTVGGKTSSVNANYQGGGVAVQGGTFEMSGGTISGNTALFGGGVYLSTSGGTFNMTGGSITDNEATNANGNGYGASVSGTTTEGTGGGVYKGSGATFNKSGTASVTGNRAQKAGSEDVYNEP